MSNVKLTDNGFLLDAVWSDQEREKIQAEIDHWQGYRYHNLLITDAEGKTVSSRGVNDPHVVIRDLDNMGFPQDLTGKTVLDIGCNSGFYSMAAKLRGASRVMGIDVSSSYTSEATALRDILGFSEEDITFQPMDGAALLAMTEQFDFVINLGVLYHIENPVAFLRATSNVTREMMLLESEALLDPAMSDYALFIEKEYGGDPSNWWIYGPNCMVGMARAAGFNEVKFEGFLWQPEEGTKTQEGYNRQGRAVLTCRK